MSYELLKSLTWSWNSSWMEWAEFHKNERLQAFMKYFDVWLLTESENFEV